jgi:hypothetical protein
MSAVAWTVFLVLPLVPLAPAPGQSGSWAGKTVILKEPGVRMSAWKEKAGNKAGTELRSPVQTVLEETDGFCG